VNVQEDLLHHCPIILALTLLIQLTMYHVIEVLICTNDLTSVGLHLTSSSVLL
jgi:hypothetical protein